MNWNEGFSASYTYAIVDPVTWRDIETHDLVSGNVMKTTSGTMESADIEITEDPAEEWVRIYLNATQGYDGAKEALFTGLLQTPTTEWEGTRKTHKANCYSVLKPANDVLLPRGWYAPAGASGARLAAELLGIGAAPAEYADASPTLASTLIAESKETNLSMARKILDTIGWRIRITGGGVIQILPAASERSAVLDPDSNDIVEVSVKDSFDWYSCPNVLRVVSGNAMAVARDDDPNSPYSTVARGREIWREETKNTLSASEGITEYAKRRLKEEQSPTRRLSYSRRYLPDILPGDIVGFYHACASGEFKITSQKMELAFGGTIQEEGEQYG